MSNRYKEYYSNITPDKALVADTLRKMREIEAAAPVRRFDIRPFAAVAACAAVAVSAVIFGPDFSSPENPAGSDFAAENAVTTSETEQTSVISPSESFTSVIPSENSESSSDTGTEETKETEKETSKSDSESENSSTQAASDTKPSAPKESSDADRTSSSTHKVPSESAPAGSSSASKPVSAVQTQASAVQTQVFTTMVMTTADKKEENTCPVDEPDYYPEVIITYPVTTVAYTARPTAAPTLRPSAVPTLSPNTGPWPTASPTMKPAEQPGFQPTMAPTSKPSKIPAGVITEADNNAVPTMAPPGGFPTKKPPETTESSSSASPAGPPEHTVFTDINGKRFAVNTPDTYDYLWPVNDITVSAEDVRSKFGTDVISSHITDKYGSPEIHADENDPDFSQGVVMIFRDMGNPEYSDEHSVMISAGNRSYAVFGLLPEYSSFDAARTEYNGTYYTLGRIKESNMIFCEFYRNGTAYSLAFRGFTPEDAVYFAENI